MTSVKSKQHLLARLKNYSSARILVLGDVMADHYLWGAVERISPEAPVPVVQVQREDFRLGGAANVACNLHALGAQVRLCAIVGDDEPGRLIKQMLRGLEVGVNGLLETKQRRTTVKTRVVAHNQQVVRVDWEHTAVLAADLRERILIDIRQSLPEINGIIVSDYGKGVVGKALLDAVRRLTAKEGIPVVIDPKIRNIKYYHDFTSMTPNHHETAQALGIKLENTDAQVHRAGKKLLRKLRLKSLVVTRGEEGMSLFHDTGQVIDIPTVAKEVYDVTGAGDTVISAIACGLATGASLHAAALIANFAAGIVIGEIGTASATMAQVAAAIRGSKDLA